MATRNRITEPLTGKVFGYLTVREFAGRDSIKNYLWLCDCVCGKTTTATTSHLMSGFTKSCGCMHKGKPKHYASYTPEHRTWGHMLERCYNEKNISYKRYGGRGITVCDRWRTDFAAFLADMGKKPSPKHTIGRIDNDGPYSPENCRWETKEQQARNKETTRLATWKGETKTIAEWAEILGFSSALLYKRIVSQGWDVERAFTTKLPWRPD